MMLPRFKGVLFRFFLRFLLHHALVTVVAAKLNLDACIFPKAADTTRAVYGATCPRGKLLVLVF